MQNRSWFRFLVILLISVLHLAPTSRGGSAEGTNLWRLANENQKVHRFSTLFTAQDVRERLSTEAGLKAAIDWCRQTAVTKVYVEEFRDGYQAERTVLLKARDQFRAAGLEVSGCITPTQVGKPSTGWKNVISCYTDVSTQEKIQAIFEYAAGMFDEIMIDDFWFTDCTCPACEAARAARTVTIGKTTFPVSGDSWEDYRGELMLQVSKTCLLAASKRVNPKVRLIIKYPQWYDRFHERGYDVARETAEFDRIWVGTESRDYGDPRWGGTPQYESYFIMRWLGGIGGEKCGGGWYDWLGTTERTYVEQARQTVLGGARESMLFCFGGLQGSTGPRDVQALRANIPELFEIAKQVGARRPAGIAAYKPANSHPGKESRVFDFVGMLGIPLVPCHEFPTNAPAAFFSVHALKDSAFAQKLQQFIAAGKPVLLTDGLVRELQGKVELNRPTVQVLNVNGDPKALLELSPADLDALRAPLLKPFHITFHAPNRVGFYLFDDGSVVLENFNDEPVRAEVNGEPWALEARSWKYNWRDSFGGGKSVHGQATGFFHTENLNGTWWFITPEGNGFFSKGVNNVNYAGDTSPKLGYSPYGRVVTQRYHSAQNWAQATTERLRGWGLNTVGAWSSAVMNTQRVAYTPVLNLATSAGANWLKGEVADVFSPKFEQAVREHAARACAEHASDPFLLGYFTDNELRWGADWRSKKTLFDDFLARSAEEPGRKIAIELLRAQAKTLDEFNQLWGTQLGDFSQLHQLKTLTATNQAAVKVRREFLHQYARAYFKICHDAIKAADPNHLVLGCRFAGYAPEEVVQAMDDFVDVVSFNNYGATVPVQQLQKLHQLTQKPVMVTEFSFKALDSGLPNTKGAGKPLATQEDRATHFQTYVNGLARLPFLVGYQWFEYEDEPAEGRFDGENSNYGLVNLQDEPWTTLVDRVTQVNAGLDELHHGAARTSGD